jgi:hypothetical protein
MDLNDIPKWLLIGSLAAGGAIGLIVGAYHGLNTGHPPGTWCLGILRWRGAAFLVAQEPVIFTK